LVRLGTVAAIVGVVAGLWNIWEYLLVCRGPLCIVPQAAPTGAEGTIVLGLAVVLLIVSLMEFLAPSALFYLSAAVGVAIDAVEALNYSTIAPGSFLVTVILVTLSVGLGLASATRKTSVSEQSHPMNLPVFG
jgi:hypothetical protein